MTHKGIIVLEGADGSGKTTLSNGFMQAAGDALYLHAGATDHPFELAMALAKEAIANCEERLVVIDRLWLSETAYGNSYRGGSRIAHGYRCFDRLMLKHAALNILCVPKDAQKHVRQHVKLREEREEMFKDISPVAAWYADLAKGNLARPGSDYGSQLIRFGDYSLRPDVELYDVFDHYHNSDFKRFVGHSLKRLKVLRELQFQPALKPEMTNFQGHAKFCKIVFVGEDLSPRGGEWPWPWFWPESVNGSADYFNALLQQIGLHEIDAAYVNAHQQPDALPGLINFFEATGKNVRYVALGKRAYSRLQGLMVDEAKIWELRHPQYVKRFKPNDPQYLQELTEAINGTRRENKDESSVAGGALLRF